MKPFFRQFDRIMDAAQPEEDSEILELFIPVRAIAKQRARVTAQGGRTPQKTRVWTDGVAAIVAEIMRDLDKPPINFPVKARYIMAFHEGSRPDIDNTEKALWDALQRGDKSGEWRAIEDDKFIRDYVEKCEKQIPKTEQPYIWVRFYGNTGNNY